jgi:ubiquinone/menaquinone biosynthesis C-methylase UbiE
MQHDVATRLPFESETFDRVLCCLALDHVVNLRSVFSELGRVCRRDGFLVTSVMHPALLLKGVQAHFHDSSTGREIRPASAIHQVSDYVMAAVEAQLRLDAVSEHAGDRSLADQAPRAERYIGWPMLLVMKLTPLSG